MVAPLARKRTFSRPVRERRSRRHHLRGAIVRFGGVAHCNHRIDQGHRGGVFARPAASLQRVGVTEDSAMLRVLQHLPDAWMHELAAIPACSCSAILFSTPPCNRVRLSARLSAICLFRATEGRPVSAGLRQTRERVLAEDQECAGDSAKPTEASAAAWRSATRLTEKCSIASLNRR